MQLISQSTISATEAKNKLGSLLARVSKDGGEIVIESRGKPQAVVMSVSQYQKIQAISDQVRRMDALARLEALRKRIQTKNRDLTPKQAEALADRFVREVIDEMVKEGKIRFKD